MKLANAGGRRAVTMIELLCVIAIIGILASLLLPAVMRSYLRIKGQAEEIEAPAIEHRLLHETRAYCAANPQYQFVSKNDFANKCRLGPKPLQWINAPLTEFVPFTYLDASNLTVLTVHIGKNHRLTFAFSKAQVSTTPDG